MIYPKKARYCILSMNIYDANMTAKNDLFHLSISSLMKVYLVMVFMVGLVSVWVIVRGWLLYVALMSVSLVFYFYSNALHHGFYHQKIMSFQHVRDNHWILYYQRHDSEQAVLHGSSVIFRHVLILHFIVNNVRRKTVVVFSDSMSRVYFQTLKRIIRSSL